MEFYNNQIIYFTNNLPHCEYRDLRSQSKAEQNQELCHAKRHSTWNSRYQNANRLAEQFGDDNIPFSSVLGSSPSVVDRENFLVDNSQDIMIN